MRALVGLIRRWDPALYLDLHVTDGMDYAYDITFGCEGCGADAALLAGDRRLAEATPTRPRSTGR